MSNYRFDGGPNQDRLSAAHCAGQLQRQAEALDNERAATESVIAAARDKQQGLPRRKLGAPLEIAAVLTVLLLVLDWFVGSIVTQVYTAESDTVRFLKTLLITATNFGLGAWLGELLREHDDLNPPHRMLLTLLLIAAPLYWALTYVLRLSYGFALDHAAQATAVGSTVNPWFDAGLWSTVAAAGMVFALATTLGRESWEAFELRWRLWGAARHLRTVKRQLAAVRRDLGDGGLGGGTRALPGALVFALAATGATIAMASAASAEPLPVCSPASQWLAGEMPAGSFVEVLLAAGDTIPQDRWRLYRAMAGMVLACAGDGSTITLRPVTRAGVSESPHFSGTVPVPDPTRKGNELWHSLGGERRPFVANALRAVDDFPQIGGHGWGSDPVGALEGAAQDLALAPAGVKRSIILIANGWVQTRELDMFPHGGTPAEDADRVRRTLKVAGVLLRLNGTHVIVAGIAPGYAKMRVTSTQVLGLCRFWRALVDSGGGTVTFCAPAFPGIVQ